MDGDDGTQGTRRIGEKMNVLMLVERGIVEYSHDSPLSAPRVLAPPYPRVQGLRALARK
jgi:hypothetical protein